MSTCILRGGPGDDDVKCPSEHDGVATGLAVFLLVGIVVSYLPQIVRIIVKKSSLGFSPWFLLLGATSSASSFLNVVALQWGLVRCCSMVSTSICAESMLGIAQVALQWLCFVSM
jgi:PQ loop repeat